MNISINAFWVYGYVAHKLGKYKYLSDLRVSRFYWLGQEYDSVWTATHGLYAAFSEQGIKVDDVDGEPMVYMELMAESGLNQVPTEEDLVAVREKLLTGLKAMGFEDVPPPNLYFFLGVG